ncbi:MAG: gliding motility-associated C-terminal domain-containing protein [Bacteroidetes bacterium]|nr:gliding motility-associated C-terminal domain-containing protein [Bacteroidota bacterium]
MKKAVFTLLLLITFPVMASHIVGGEFELVYISGSTYRLSVILYFDKINGIPGAKDFNILATIYRKKDNVVMGSHNLPILSDVEVPYSQPGCANTSLKTNRLFYSANITLASDVYNDPDGYYVSWQRCCRNYTIDNIYSLANSSSLYAGQTFYLEFPAVVKDGKPFINSSPRLFPPLSDYACPFRQFYVNFAGVDDDKDSLVYSLVTPLNTKSTNPSPSPRPYPDVIWRPGFSLNNIMNGQPDLKISKDGLLTVTPTLQGLFVFAVKVEEFRKGVKIGESRRDFQMLATESNACRASFPPVAMGTTNAPGDVTPRKKIELTYDVDDPAQNRCVKILVSDNTSTEANSNLEEKVSIRAVPLNFKTDNLNEILPAITTDVVRNGSTKEFMVCFPQCPYTNGPYQVGIITFDDTCPQPLLDTLKITVNVTTQNRRARFTSPTTKTISETVREGETRSWNIEGIDADNDLLTLAYTTNGFKMEDFGFRFSNADFSTRQGPVQNTLIWEPECDKYPFFRQSNFKFRFLLDDTDLPCKLNPPDTLTFDLYFQEFPKNASPTISTDGLGAPPNATKIKVERKIFEPLNFSVRANDVDNDFLVLSGRGVGFNMSDFGLAFPNTNGNGIVAANFSWNITCNKLDLTKKDTYTFKFIVVDNLNRCRFYKADTVDVEVKILKPDNVKPVVTAIRNSQQINLGATTEYFLGSPLEINLIGTDADRSPTDSLSLSLIEADGDLKPEGFSFKNIKGTSGLQSIFYWQPTCSIFKNNVFSNTYSFKFGIQDNRCFNQKADTLSFNISVSDVGLNQKPFYMPNIITPNGDKRNDYLALEGIDDELTDPETGSLDEKVSLPLDNCVQKFQSIKIFNRWGDLVFQSTDRKFRWYASQESSGVYYYVVKYNNREYKSPISVRY